MQIENDPEETGIPQDDMDGVFAKGIVNGEHTFLYINDTVTSLVLTANYDNKTKQHIFDEDTEWCSCLLSNEMVQALTNAGKKFYSIEDIPILEIKSGAKIILSGFPGYAQKENHEEYRSYESEVLEDQPVADKGLIRVDFDNSNAYNFEKGDFIKIPKCGIRGMSGGGMWHETETGIMPIGIILKQTQCYVEGFRLDSILNMIDT